MRKLSKSASALILFMAVLFLAASASAAVIRVKPDGDDANSGTSWALAKKTVQAAIDAAAEGDEIWVAAGTYLEHIKNKVIDPVIDPVAVNVALYGGFAGTETERNQRNCMTNLTVLDGGNQEVPSPPAVGSVVYISGGAGRATHVDGFVITGGNAIAGGGILIEGSGPTVANNNIWGNSASIGGGIGVSNYDILPPTLSHPVITDNRVFGNSAVEGGGGIAVVGSETLAQSGFDPAAPVIARNVISQNKCMMNGGGIGCWGHTAAVIEGNVIVANAAANDESTFAGGGGGIYATSRDLDDQPLSFAICAPRIISNAIVANGGFLGAGIQCWDTEDAHGGIPLITNNTIASNNGIGIYWRESSPVMTNNLVVFNPWGLQQPAGAPASPTISHNNVYGNSVRGQRTDYVGVADQTGLSGNISIDPLLANARIGDIRIQPNSPCRDAGTTSAVEDGWKDVEGADRVQGSGVDIGADESDGTVWSVPTPVIRVRPDGDDAEDGSTWAKAKRTVGAGITAAFLGGGGEVWVAEGTYFERNAVNAFIYLYGGFAGTETSRDQRDFVAHPTVLDGDGVPNVITVGRAGYLTSAIDGFTIRNGGTYTDGEYPYSEPRYGSRGGGINCRQGSPLIENNIITENSIGDPLDNANKPAYGGGLYIYMYFGLIRGNTFHRNEVLNTFDGSGGGIHAFYSMPTIQGNTFTQNHAENGAAIYATLSQPNIIGNTVENNNMYLLGSLYTGAAFGAIRLLQNEDFLVQGNMIRGNTAGAGAGIAASANGAGKILNNLITGNVAENAQHTGGMGGGMSLEVLDAATGDLIVANNTIVGNTATVLYMPWPMNEQGGGVALILIPALPPPPEPPPAKIVLANNIIAFNSSGVWQYPVTPMPIPTLVNNDVFGSTSGDNCNYLSVSPGAAEINLDPLFAGPGAGDYRLQAASPCVDAGDNGRVPAALTADFEGKPRIIDGDGDASAVVDMGVYEFTSGTDTTAPTVTITAPTGNPTYVTSQAVIDLAGTASDNVGVTGVTWSNDRGGGGTCDGTTDWTASGILLFIGQNVITVTARDQVSGGNAGTDILTVTYTLPVAIEGHVTTPGGGGIEGVVMSGLPSTPTTDLSGYYIDTAVPSGWSGTVTPVKAGWTFDPPSKIYTNVVTDQIGQIYIGAGGLAAPTVTTAPATSVTSSTARAGGAVVWDGGAAVTARGVCWDFTPNPTIEDYQTDDGTGDGSFASEITGLMAGFTYYVRAYATNSVGTAYGDQISFTTQSRDYIVPFTEAFGLLTRPADWTVQIEGAGVADPWTVVASDSAGGAANEMMSVYQNAYGTVRLVTPPIDTRGCQTLRLTFRHFLDSWDLGGVRLKVQTSPDGLDWTDEAWSVVTDPFDIGPELIQTVISNNLDSRTTYVAFVMDGDLFYFESWFIDEISISSSSSAKVDFNGDGQEDILWRYYGEGAYQGLNVAWLMNQTEILSPALLKSDQAAARGRSLLSGAPAGVVYQASRGEEAPPTITPAGGSKSVLSGEMAPVLSAKNVMRVPVEHERGRSRQEGESAGEWDGRECLVRQDAASPEALGSGEARIASLQLATEVVFSQIADTGWEIAGTGDFNGDTKTDILWRYYGVGDYQGLNDIWFMDGTTFIGESVFSQIADTNWRIAGTGDFNSDGQTDILWRYYGAGEYQGLNVIWYMNGAQMAGEAVFSQVLDTDWRIEGTGDFNGDGQTDILWRYYGAGDYQGLNDIWFMNGTTFVGESVFSQIMDTAWQIGGLGDFNGDGQTDILWRYYGQGPYQGLNDIWYMNGTAFVSEEVFSQIPDTNWRIVNR